MNEYVIVKRYSMRYLLWGIRNGISCVLVYKIKMKFGKKFSSLRKRAYGFIFLFKMYGLNMTTKLKNTKIVRYYESLRYDLSFQWLWYKYLYKWYSNFGFCNCTCYKCVQTLLKPHHIIPSWHSQHSKQCWHRDHWCAIRTSYYHYYYWTFEFLLLIFEPQPELSKRSFNEHSIKVDPVGSDGKPDKMQSNCIFKTIQTKTPTEAVMPLSSTAKYTIVTRMIWWKSHIFMCIRTSFLLNNL